MNSKKEIERHRLPCGAVTIAIDGVCRKRLRDKFDDMLDSLTRETHPEGVDAEILEIDEVELPEQEEIQETPDEMKARLLDEGILKAEVKHAVGEHMDKLQGNSKMLQNKSGKIEKR